MVTFFVYLALVSGLQSQSAATAIPAAELDTKRCIDVRNLRDKRVTDATHVRLLTRDGRAWSVEVRRTCPDLAFHNYVTFIPVGGALCAGRDDMISREGYSCRINRVTPLTAGAQNQGPAIN